MVPVVARRKRQAAAAVPDAKDEEYEDDDQSAAATGGQYIIYHCYNKTISIIWVNKIPLILFSGQKVVRYVTLPTPTGMLCIIRVYSPPSNTTPAK